MKVISGKYKGKNLKGFDINGTRPTMDRVKESLFAMIQDYIKDSIVLDLFAGSGSLGIEAISEGCKKVYFVDNNSIAINTIKDNLKGINEDFEVIKKDYLSFLEEISISFDIILLDPPYDTNLIEKTLEYLNNNLKLLNNNSLIVCETTKSIDFLNYNNFRIYKERTYNDKKVTILKYEK